MSGPLSGIRVLDMTTVLMGPFATQLLGDMGADIVKVEPPGGDVVRGIGPQRNPGMGAIFLNVNRNKRSIVLDLKRPGGREALLRLSAGADVLVSNMRPAALARLGLTYQDLAAANPSIIYAGLYGFGQEGPYAAKPAYDDLIQGAVGIPTLSVEAGAETPRYAPSALVDRIVGTSAVNAIVAALFHRLRTGEGQSIEVPMFETMAQFILGDHLAGQSFDPPLGPPGYARILNPHRKPYATRDGYLCVMFYNDRQWQAFFGLIGQPEILRTDERFSTIGRRTEHVRELYALVEQAMSARTTAEWTRALEAADIPTMPLHTLDSLIADPHLKAVGFLHASEHPSEGSLRVMRNPTTWSRSRPAPARPAPRLGEHTAELLREAGYTQDELNRMVTTGAIPREFLPTTRDPAAAGDREQAIS